MTILLTPFLSCGAKLPIYALFAAVFFPGAQALTVAGIYALGLLMMAVSGVVLRRTLFPEGQTPFVMELGDYRLPTLRPVLRRLKDTPQSPVHHPEGNVWNHTMLVVDEAAKRRAESRCPAALMWAALLHDIGKPDTTRVRRGKITSYDHDKVGAELARRFLSGFSMEPAMIDRVCALVRFHMQVLFAAKGLPFGDAAGMKAHADIQEVALLGLCDRMGRLHADLEEETENIRTFLRLNT